MAKILLIEDQSFSATIMEKVLARAGHAVDVARDGERGLMAFGANKPDLVITDMILPNMDGLAVIREIQARAPGFPVIALSGGGAAGMYNYLDEARELGAVEVFRKPVAAEQLLEAISRWVDPNPPA
jgi:two-component system, cell cycle sensor histidine kinase and response regulator CckA